MKHLETKREAAECHRVTLMSKGIANFLERTSDQIDSIDASLIEESSQETASGPELEQSPRMPPRTTPMVAQDSVLGKIKLTLNHAADILRESLELVVGGVVFLDAAPGYLDTESIDTYLDISTDIGTLVYETNQQEKIEQNLSYNKITLTPPHQQAALLRHLSSESTRSSNDKHKASKILAMSAAKIATWDSGSDVLDAKTLQSFINSYPKGNVWYIDEEGYFSSLDHLNNPEESSDTNPSGRRGSIAPTNIASKKAEATMLSRIFHKARQIIFLPLWDAGAGEPCSYCSMLQILI